MKRAIFFAVVAILVLGSVLTASVGTATGTTALLGTASAGSSVDVDVSVVSATPVVAYEYSMVNACYFSGKTSGPADAYQRDDIVNWVYSSSNGTIPHATMTAYLTQVPAGAVCKVYLVKNNTFVKGSLTQYSVH